MAATARVQAILELRDQMSAGLRRAGSGVKAFAGEARGAVGHLGNFASGIGRAARSMADGFGARASALVSRYFMALKISAGIGVAMLGALATKAVAMAQSFDESLRLTTALIRGTGASSEMADAEYQALFKGVLALAPKVGKSVKDLSAAMYDLGSAGFTTANGGLKVMEAAARGAAAGNAQTQTVTKALVQSLNAYGVGADKAASFTDTMFQAVNVGQLTFEEFSSNLGTVVGLASAAKVPFDQLAGAVALMTKRGIEAPEAFTSLNRLLAGVVAPSPEVTKALDSLFGGAAGTKEKFSALTLSTSGLTGLMKNLMNVLKPTGAQMAAFKSGSADVVEAAINQFDAGKIEAINAVFGDIRGMRGALALTAEEGYTFNDVMKDMGASTGAVDRGFDEWSKSTASAKAKFSALLDVVKISIASGLLPGITKQFEGMTKWLQRIVDSPAFQGAGMGGKLKILGAAFFNGISKWWDDNKEKVAELGNKTWAGVLGWWEDHKSEAERLTRQGFEWFGKTAIPWVTEAGIKLGKALVPAIWGGVKAAASTPAGAGVLALLVGGKLGGFSAVGKGLGIGGGGDAALGGSAGALNGAAAALTRAAVALGGSAQAGVGAATAMGATGGPGFIKGLFPGGLIANVASVALSAGIIYFVGQALIKSIKEFATGGANQEAGLTGQVKTATDEKLAAGAKAAANPGWQMRAYGAFPGRERPDEIIAAEQKRRSAKAKHDHYLYNTEAGMKQQFVSSTKASSPARGKQMDEWFQMRRKELNSGYTSLADVNKAVEAGTAGHKAKRLFDEAFTMSKIYAEEAVTGTDKASIAQSGYFTSLLSWLDVTKAAVAGLGAPKISAPGAVTPPLPGAPVLKAAPGMKDARGRTIVSNNLVGPVSGSQVRQRDAIAPFRKMAFGGTGTVSKPTMFMAGEAGAEDFAFGPHAKGGLGGGTSFVIQGPLIGQANISKDMDINDVADKLVTALESRAQNSAPAR